MIALDTDLNRLTYGGVGINLTRSQAIIVRAMSDGRIADFDRLITALYPAQEPEWGDGILKIFICKIRAKAKKSGMGPLILTVWGRGYRMITPVAITGAVRDIVVPHRLRDTLELLLRTHPDRNAASLVLASFVTA